ncbi:MAG: phosphatidate cytidylyltransferase [Gammaproteobacteria bacterium]|nr:phosphatidate cytidylyltransferase [Gammaproteobacteria bacterium]
MLVKRVLTALVLVPLVLALIYLANQITFAIAIAVLMLAAALEWLNLSGKFSLIEKIAYCVSLSLLFLIAYFTPMIYAFGLAVIWWLFAIYLIVKYPNINADILNKKVIRLLIGAVLFVSSWLGFVLLHIAGSDYVMLVLLLVWAADSFAYFTGVLIGEHKIFPKVSPGKSYEGLLGGVLGALIVTQVALWFFNIQITNELGWLILILATTIISVAGDLFISMIKRIANVKDSGNLLPGHGGILDRIDSWLAAIPIFTLLYFILF